MNKELKPCPFCGAEEIYRTYVKSHWALCSRCGSVGGSGLDEAEAIKKWNTRAYESELQSLRAENERFKSVFEEITSPHYWFNYADALSTNMSMKINDLFLTALKDSNNE